MIQISNQQILINGKPRIIVCGEIHYFRLPRDEWQDRIEKLRAAGCNAVASYVPWLCHEPAEGNIDLDGRTRRELDLGGFVDCCKANDLYFFVRPGPFIMAEMKNEGLPYWLYTKHPEIVPVSWDGKLVPTRTVDYLAPGFLEEVRRWYRAVMAVIVPRLHANGGNIIAVQLDNEIGMLAWLSNCPDLTDHVLADFAAWLSRRYDGATLKLRYPFALTNAQIRNAALRSPDEAYAAELMRDLGHYMRDRFARYVATLRQHAEEFGVRDVPFVINVHGAEHGRGLTYPSGLSQLYQTYTQAPGYLAGSDHYLGDLQVRNFQDLYLINALTAATSRAGHPPASVELEAGSGDYGGDDSNDRIAFTGERHGVAAPLSPEGALNYTYPRMARATKTVMAVADKLAAMHEEYDRVAFAWIPDYYLTESRYPPSIRMREVVSNPEANRGLVRGRS